MQASQTPATSCTSLKRAQIFTARDERRRSSESNKTRLTCQAPSAWSAGSIVSIVVRHKRATHRKLKQLLPGLYLMVKSNPNHRGPVPHRTTHPSQPTCRDLIQSSLSIRTYNYSHSAFTVATLFFIHKAILPERACATSKQSNYSCTCNACMACGVLLSSADQLIVYIKTRQKRPL